MVSLALRQGVRLGWLDAALLEDSDRAWSGVSAQVDGAGQLQGVSGETPPGDADFYQQIEVGVYPWGQGFGLLAALERSFPDKFDSSNLLLAASK
jgi:rhamnogalacturonyl hydrolase YesR